MSFTFYVGGRRRGVDVRFDGVVRLMSVCFWFRQVYLGFEDGFEMLYGIALNSCFSFGFILGSILDAFWSLLASIWGPKVDKTVYKL